MERKSEIKLILKHLIMDVFNIVSNKKDSDSLHIIQSVSEQLISNLKLIEKYKKELDDLEKA